MRGEFRHMISTRRLVESELPDASVLVVEDGSEVTLENGGLSAKGQFPAPYIYRSNAQGPVVSNRVIKERRSLQSGGALFFFLVLHESGSISVSADQVGWLNSSLFAEDIEVLTTELRNLASDARDRGVAGDDLENHPEAKMRRFTRESPHVVVIAESASNGD